ncbi:elongation factor P 5-aminopentanone reductase [Ornithinibacillus halotolerans]|uniref:Oxidoreductase YmfI n=1 Tax=Ornithinibacillus halotolerans TaxID=1274357 RepID=A0A916RPY6_9BACI|nr:SDR family oxidoreductase [Ornithinibacillus halotolerans]GGA62517.1 putative oxidoreductase YmfI [Ornithinibacillus halotolerans]
MGKTVLVIGASGDIGSEIAVQLGKEGYSLLLHYNQNRNMIGHVINRLPEESIMDVIQADLSTSEGIEQFLSNILYSVDAIVFASGIAYYGLFQETPNKVMDEMISIHVKAPMLIVKSLLPEMVKRKSGKVILVSSIWGEMGASYEVLYSAVKGAQNSFVKSLAKEVGPSGITVNAVSPGFIRTKMNPFSMEEINAIVDEIPLNRAGTTKDVANAVSFLLSEKASYIHGEILTISGGWS